MTIDNWTKQIPGDFFYGYVILRYYSGIYVDDHQRRQGTIEEKAVVQLEAKQAVDVLVEYTNSYPPPGKDEEGRNTPSAQPALMRGLRLGGCEVIDADAAVEEAVKLAEDSDAVVFIASLGPEWESEGFDRSSLDLPGRQAEVISKVGSVNPNTIVCIQAVSVIAVQSSKT